MAPGIGLGIAGVAESIGASGGGSFTAALLDDFFFEEDGNQNLQPRYFITDNNSMWDLDASSHIEPEPTPSTEGWFETDGDGNNMPIA